MALWGGHEEGKYRLDDPSHPNSLRASDHRICRTPNAIGRVYYNPPDGRLLTFATCWNHLENIKKYFVLDMASKDPDLTGLGYNMGVQSWFKLP